MAANYHGLFWGAFAPVVSLDALIEATSDNSCFDIPDIDAKSAFETLASEEAAALVRWFVSTLSARERMIVHEIYWNNRTQTDVASELGVSKMAISKAVARIHNKGRLALIAINTH